MFKRKIFLTRSELKAFQEFNSKRGLTAAEGARFWPLLLLDTEERDPGKTALNKSITPPIIVELDYHQNDKILRAAYKCDMNVEQFITYYCQVFLEHDNS